MGDPEALLADGRVDEAVAALLEAVEASDDPSASVLLGGLCYFDDDWDGARQWWERAHAWARSRGDRRTAARVAALLGELHWSALGNHAAGRGWLRKADRLLHGDDRCVERGWVDLALVACEANLEVRALADSGYALVAQGRTAEGFDRLDEALATITGGQTHDLGAVAMSFCAMLSACEQSGAIARAEEWTRLIRELLLDRFDGRPRVLHTHCRLAYGSVLCSIGQWTDGEATLREAVAASATSAHHADASLRLGQLRVLQGRLDEAAELIAPFEDRFSAALPLALLHRARGEPELAIAAIERGIDGVVGDRLREATLLDLLVELELARDVDRARAAAERLAEVAARCDAPAVHAEAALAAGRVAASAGDAASAIRLLGEAAGHLPDEDRPLLGGRIRFERALALRALGDEPGAVVEARAARATFERLGAQPDVDRTSALLRSLGASVARPRASVGDLTGRERDVLDLVRQGLTNAEIGERLFISAKTVEHHVGRVLAKLGVRTRAEAAAVAAAIGGRD